MAHFSLVILAIITSTVWSQVRYTFLPSRYNGLFDKEFTVASLDECSLAATDKNKIGCRVTIKSEEKKEMTCAFLRQFSRFESRSDPNDYDFILDTKADDNVCLWNTVRNGNRSVWVLFGTSFIYISVSQFISGSCTVKGADCAVFESIKAFCTFVGTDVAECLSLQYTVKNVECPSGQITVDLKKGKHLCCPIGEQLAEERNGKAYCCPSNKKLKGIFNGKSICCNPNDNYKTGTSFCCPTGKQFSSGNGLERCCPSGLVPSKSISGSIGCCPNGRTYVKTQNGDDHCCPNGEEFGKREGGIDYCCPEGKIFQEVKNGKSICCSNGLTLKGYHNGMPQCCLADSNYDSASGTCCGKGYFYQRNGNDGKCCEEGQKLKRAPNGKVRCCSDDNPIVVPTDDDSVHCCPLMSTRAKVNPKSDTAYQYTVKNIECPSGQITVDLRKGKHLCYPLEEQLAEE
ncbi:hypothetical protein QR680_004236 [Steinernema hermaphroditum]|uniref:Uncharacterized protein n=1 Tax=Steinernema hermaphroditum TaxID=289476 RepID=A0AA39HP53_9BILA|nr:hypothetical protein QR680_004236 [Steinernema hermaphroditum]